jgi:hypothetical protein
MLVVRFGNLRFGLALATALAVSLLWTAAAAYTPEQQQACSDDAFRLCGADIPDVDRVTVCMVRNKAQLSPGCRVFFGPEPEATPANAARPLSIKPANGRKSVGAKKSKKKPAS